MNKHLILYSTTHCHLCELAHALVMQANGEIDLKVIDIADDDDLLAQYGVRIPVLQRLDTQAELNWPFNADDILKFLDNKKASN
jgi:glutaredoxin 2